MKKLWFLSALIVGVSAFLIVLLQFDGQQDTYRRVAGDEPSAKHSILETFSLSQAQATAPVAEEAAEALPSTEPAITDKPAPAPSKAAPPKPKPPAAPTCTGDFAAEFLCLLNNYRVSQGKGRLSYNMDMGKVALGHSQWMADTDTFSHFDKNGGRFINRCAAAGVKCRAENLAMNASSAQNLFDMWKASPSHNANLLGPYTKIGMAVAGSYITALFN